MKILLVDDDFVIRRLYREELEDEGYDVVEAVSGVQAFKVLKESEPDLMILDIMMPEMDGVETLKKVREQCPGIPVIISSAYDYNEDIMVHAPNSYVLKSSDTAELKMNIKSILEQRTEE